MSFLIENILKKSHEASFHHDDHQGSKQELISKPYILENVLRSTYTEEYEYFVHDYRSSQFIQQQSQGAHLNWRKDPFPQNFALDDLRQNRCLFGKKYKRKGGQIRFTVDQVNILEKRFVLQKYLAPEDRRNLALLLNLTDRQVKTWFQNRRAKWKKMNSVDLSIERSRCKKKER